MVMGAIEKIKAGGFLAQLVVHKIGSIEINCGSL